MVSYNNIFTYFYPQSPVSVSYHFHFKHRKNMLTIIVWPFTYENKGLATAKIALAASLAVPGLLRGMSAYTSLPAVFI